MSDEEKKEETPATEEQPPAAVEPGPEPEPVTASEPEASPEPEAKRPVPAGPVEPERAEAKSEDKERQKAERAAAKAQVEADYREAKAQLKSARKRAGKSNAPKIVGGIVLGLALVAGGAAGGWFFAHQWGEQQIGQLQTQLSSTQKQLNQANDQVSATTSILNGGSRAYSGSWSGELISTLGAATKRCYGASEKPMSMNIESISATGQMELSVDVLYHGHETATLPNDAKSSAGDAMVRSGQITSTFSSKSFTFRVDAGKDGNYAVVTVSPTTSADAHIQLGVVVESYYKDSLVETDQYLLKKKGDTSSAGGSLEPNADASSSSSSSADSTAGDSAADSTAAADVASSAESSAESSAQSSAASSAQDSGQPAD